MGFWYNEVMKDIVLVTQGLTKVFPPQIGQPAKQALHDLTLEIREGETFGLLGPNGAGKTTTQKLLLGLCRPTSGSIAIFGKSPEHPSIRQEIGFLPENPYFYTYLTGQEFLAFCGGMYGLSGEALKSRIGELLALVDMESAANVQLRKYSKGMLQRVGIAQALINDPKLVFLDEPMSGLDPVGRRQFRQIILELKQQGKTLFFNSHILSDVEEICDRFGILDQGHLVAQKSIKEVQGSLEDYFVEVVSK